MKEKVLILASVASMIDQFNIPNIKLLQNIGYEVHVKHVILKVVIPALSKKFKN